MKLRMKICPVLWSCVLFKIFQFFIFSFTLESTQLRSFGKLFVKKPGLNTLLQTCGVLQRPHRVTRGHPDHSYCIQSFISLFPSKVLSISANSHRLLHISRFALTPKERRLPTPHFFPSTSFPDTATSGTSPSSIPPASLNTVQRLIFGVLDALDRLDNNPVDNNPPYAVLAPFSRDFKNVDFCTYYPCTDRSFLRCGKLVEDRLTNYTTKAENTPRRLVKPVVEAPQRRVQANLTYTSSVFSLSRVLQIYFSSSLHKLSQFKWLLLPKTTVPSTALTAESVPDTSFDFEEGPQNFEDGLKLVPQPGSTLSSHSLSLVPNPLFMFSALSLKEIPKFFVPLASPLQGSAMTRLSLAGDGKFNVLATVQQIIAYAIHNVLHTASILSYGADVGTDEVRGNQNEGVVGEDIQFLDERSIFEKYVMSRRLTSCKEPPNLLYHSFPLAPPGLRMSCFPTEVPFSVYPCPSAAHVSRAMSLLLLKCVAVLLLEPAPSACGSNVEPSSYQGCALHRVLSSSKVNIKDVERLGLPQDSLSFVRNVVNKNLSDYSCDFIGGDYGSRLINNDPHKPKEVLSKACGIRHRRSTSSRILPNAKHDLPKPIIWDMTAGLGRDSIMLGSEGYQIRMFEKDLVIANLLRDGLRRLYHFETSVGCLSTTARLLGLHVTDSVARTKLHHSHCNPNRDLKDENKPVDNADSSLCLLCLAQHLNEYPDVIFLDPMFASKNRKSNARKDMQVLRSFLSDRKSSPVDDLLLVGCLLRPRRIVLKLHAHEDKRSILDLKQVTSSWEGHTHRFDVYQMSDKDYEKILASDVVGFMERRELYQR